MNDSAKEIPFGDLGTGKPPVDPYISKEHFEREKEVIWRNNWLLAGRESEVAEVNDFMVFDIAVLSMSILITRAKDEKLRAFHNVCKHRGNKLCHKASGSSSKFTCSFHAWTYDPEGQLRAVPWEETFPEGVDRKDAALSPIQVDTWGGFVFVHVNPEPKHSLKDYMNGFPEPMEAYLREPDWRWFAGNSYMVKHNWKLGVEGNECYHAGVLHNSTFGLPVAKEQVKYSIFDSPGVLSRETLFLPDMMAGMPPGMPEGMPPGMPEGLPPGMPEGLPPGMPEGMPPGMPEGMPPGMPDPMQMMQKMMEAMRTPVEGLAATYSKIALFSGKDILSDESDPHAGATNVENNPLWLFDGFYLFPNHFMVHQKGEFHLFTLWPVDVNTSIYHWDSFQIGEPENFGQLFGEMQKVVFTSEVTPEDIYVAECMQKSFESGAIDSVYVCDGEVNVRAFQKRVVEGL